MTKSYVMEQKGIRKNKILSNSYDFSKMTKRAIDKLYYPTIYWQIMTLFV
ncbi:hypothetical protein [Proteus columbae]|nr:hypothetical protein [Proteus columbae]